MYNPHEEEYHEAMRQAGFMFEIICPVDKIIEDPAIQMRVKIDEAAVERYVDMYRRKKVPPPLDVFYDEEGDKLQRVADGFQRLRAAKIAGVESLPIRVHRGTVRDAILFACGANDGHGAMYKDEDKRKAVLTLLYDHEWSKRSNPWIAETCKCSEFLVRTIKEEITTEQKRIGNFDLNEDKTNSSTNSTSSTKSAQYVDSSVVSTETRQARRKGKEYSIKTANIGKRSATKTEVVCQGCFQSFPPKETWKHPDNDDYYCEPCFSALNLTEPGEKGAAQEETVSPSAHDQESAQDGACAEGNSAYFAESYNHEEETAPKGAPTIQPSDFDGWNTPPNLLEIIRRFKGEVALDPCSNLHSQVGARLSFTEEDDGLHADWADLLACNSLSGGLVFVNPPYDTETLSFVALHSAEQLKKGAESLHLVPAKLDQEWFQEIVWQAASALCFVRGRVKFWRDGKPASGSAFVSLFIYWGADTTGFQEVFSAIGRVVDLTALRHLRGEQ